MYNQKKDGNPDDLATGVAKLGEPDNGATGLWWDLGHSHLKISATNYTNKHELQLVFNYTNS